jgi:hypothetical protein
MADTRYILDLATKLLPLVDDRSRHIWPPFNKSDAMSSDSRRAHLTPMPSSSEAFPVIQLSCSDYAISYQSRSPNVRHWAGRPSQELNAHIFQVNQKDMRII